MDCLRLLFAMRYDFAPGSTVDLAQLSEEQLDRQLWYAVETRQTQLVQDCLRRGANPNVTDLERGQTAFQLSRFGLDLIRCLLIEAGAVDREIPTLLGWAVGTGRVHTVKAVLSQGAAINAVEPQGTALQLAAQLGYCEIVELLLSRGAALELGTAIGTPLLEAIARGHWAIAQRLLQAGADPNHAPTLGHLPLAMAVNMGAHSMVKTLLQAGADPYRRDFSGQSPYAWAMVREDASLGLILAESRPGARPDAQGLNAGGHDAEGHDAGGHDAGGHGDSLGTGFRVGLRAAIATGDLSQVRAALEAEQERCDGAIDWSTWAGQGNHPLVEAATQGQLGIVRVLLQSGADVNSRNDRDETALMRAAAQLHGAMVELLLSEGAAVNLLSQDRDCALALAAGATHWQLFQPSATPSAYPVRQGEQGLEQLRPAPAADVLAIAQQLVEHGADPNLPNTSTTPLMEAVRYGQRDLVLGLLALGAQPDAPAYDGQTALDLAHIYSRPEFLELLLNIQALQFQTLQSQDLLKV